MHGFVIANAAGEELQDYANVINGLLIEDKLKARIARVQLLAEAASAHRLLEDSQRGLVKLGGKVILTV